MRTAAIPPWLSRWRRICAALAAHEALAPEDDDALLAAFKASAQARWDDGVTSIESELGLPAKWRSIKRQTDQASVLALCVGAGFRGRDGARRLHLAARRYQIRRSRTPDDDSDVAYRLWQVYGEALPAEGTLAKHLK
jgi:hypothetical protein